MLVWCARSALFAIISGTCDTDSFHLKILKDYQELCYSIPIFSIINTRHYSVYTQIAWKHSKAILPCFTDVRRAVVIYWKNQISKVHKILTWWLMIPQPSLHNQREGKKSVFQFNFCLVSDCDLSRKILFPPDVITKCILFLLDIGWWTTWQINAN